MSDIKNELALIRHFARSIGANNYLDQRLFLLRHIDRLADIADAELARAMDELDTWRDRYEALLADAQATEAHFDQVLGMP